MISSFNKLTLIALTAFAVLSIGMTPAADARGFGGGGFRGGGFRGGGFGGGGFGGGGFNHGGFNHGGFGGGGERPSFDNADMRTNDVRSTSVNSVNVNRNVNVNDHYGGWDDDYHPVARAAAIGAGVAVGAAIVGSLVDTLPADCIATNYGGMFYQQCGNVWYQPQGEQYVVVNSPY